MCVCVCLGVVYEGVDWVWVCGCVRDTTIGVRGWSRGSTGMRSGSRLSQRMGQGQG